MTKTDALKLFYAKNGIDPTAIHPHDRIAALPQMVDDWLANIDPSDQPAFLEALSRYTYLTQQECQNRFVLLLEMLEEKLKEQAISLEEVLYITIESTGGIKSGGDNVRADMQIYNFNKIDNDQVVASQFRFSSSQLSGIKALVFVDDLIGTGKTMWRNFHQFCKEYHITGTEQPLLYYMCLSPTDTAIAHLNKNFAKYHYSVTPIYKDAWISSRAFSGDSDHYRTIYQYEKKIDAFFDGATHSYCMGFEKGQLLLSFYYNTPNNTISSFWRPTDFNRPPFERKGKECKRPGIASLKAKKKASDANSYSFVRQRRNNELY